MKLRLEATTDELREKAAQLIDALALNVEHANPELAKSLRSAVRDEPTLKYPVMRALQRSSAEAYDEQMAKMLGEVNRVIDGKPLRKSLDDGPGREGTVPKIDGTSAHLRQVQAGDGKCGHCERFIPAVGRSALGRCSLVAGNIHPRKSTCDLFEPNPAEPLGLVKSTGLDLVKAMGGHKYKSRKRVGDHWEYDYGDAKHHDIKIHPQIGGGGEHKFHTRTLGDGTVKLSRHEAGGYGPTMPPESVSHFVNDLAGRVELPPSANPLINQVIEGEAKFLGKGDDGLAFKAGDSVVKVSTTVPFQPENPGHRSPDQAADMLKGQVEVGNLLADKGIKGVQRSTYVRHGDKGFQIKAYVEIPEKFTREQLDAVQDTLIEIHKAGYSINDAIQPGIDADGKPVMFDVGKADKIPEGEDPTDIYSRARGDMDAMKRLYEEHGQDFVRRDFSEGLKALADIEKRMDTWMPTQGKPAPPGFVHKNMERALAKRAKELKATLKGEKLDDALDELDDELFLYRMNIEDAGFTFTKYGPTALGDEQEGLTKSVAHKYTSRKQVGGKWVYQYGMRNRPPAPGAIPKGEFEHEFHPDFRHGAIGYEKPLSDEDQKGYELTPLLNTEGQQAVVEATVADLSEHLSEFLEMADADPKFGERMIRQRLAEHPGHFDYDALIPKVDAALRAKGAITKAKDPDEDPLEPGDVDPETEEVVPDPPDADEQAELDEAKADEDAEKSLRKGRLKKPKRQPATVIDHTQAIADRDAAAYQQARAQLIAADPTIVEDDFDTGGPYYGQSTNQLNELIRTKREQ